MNQKETKLFKPIRDARALIKTLQGQTEIDEVETAAGQFPLRLVAVVLLAQAERGRPRALLHRRVAPQVGPAVSVRDVEQSDALQRRTVGQVQRHSVALRE